MKIFYMFLFLDYNELTSGVFFSVAHQPNSGLDRVIVEVSRSHTHTHTHTHNCLSLSSVSVSLYLLKE